VAYSLVRRITMAKKRVLYYDPDLEWHAEIEKLFASYSDIEIIFTKGIIEASKAFSPEISAVFGAFHPLFDSWPAYAWAQGVRKRGFRVMLFSGSSHGNFDENVSKFDFPLEVEEMLSFFRLD
jgi:hypothetical protein